MINISNATEKRVRQTTAPFIYTENGEEKTASIRVRYFDLTVKQLKERQEKLAAEVKIDPDKLVWLSDTLIERLESLPDIIGDDKKPVELTLEFLESLSLENLKAIKNAIEENDNPKPSPA